MDEVNRLVEVIKNLMASDNELIQKATAEMKQAFKRIETVSVLCHILVAAPEEHVRQYSALLLKKFLAKRYRFNKVPAEQHKIIQQHMINTLKQEEQECVRKAIAEVISTLLCHEAEGCESYMCEIWQLICSSCSSADANQRELGSSVFAILAETALDKFLPHIKSACDLVADTLCASDSTGNMATPVLSNILCGMTYLVPFTSIHKAAGQTLQQSVPLIIKSLAAFAEQPETYHFVKAFDILESIAELNPKILNNDMELLTSFCLQLSKSIHLGSAVRVKALSYIGFLAQMKKKTLIKLKLVGVIVDVVFDLMATEPEGDDADYFLGDDYENPITSATQTMGTLAMNIPAEKLLTPLVALLHPAFMSQDPLRRRAAYLSLGVIADGCSESICTTYFEILLDAIKMGITDATPSVRNAAFYALGQFSEHLQPDISKYASQIMPLLLDFLQQLCGELKTAQIDPKNIDGMFYAVESFCEHLDEELLPYLPMLMEILFDAMNPNHSVHIREMALSLVSAAANATEKNMMPYFEHLMNMLRPYMDHADTEDLLAPGINTLAALVDAVGKENFMPFAPETMNFALQLIEKTEESDVRSALYKLIAALSKVLEESMVSAFPKIFEHTFHSIQSTETAEDRSEDDNVPPIIDLDEASESDMEVDEETDEENCDDCYDCCDDDPILEEKREALLALKEFAESTGVAFLPHVQISYDNIYKMIDCQEADIRKVSVETLCAFVIASYKHNDLYRVGKLVTSWLPKLSQIVRKEDNIVVVLAALEGISDILSELDQSSLAVENLRNCVFDCIVDVLQGKVTCQHTEEEDEDDDESEYDEEIIKVAVDILPLFGMALVTPETFFPYFNRLYPIIVQKLKKATQLNVLSNFRSAAYHCFAESFEALADTCGPLFDTFLPIMITGLSDNDEEVREGAIYGLGQLVLYSDQNSYQSYPLILKALSDAIEKETGESVRDNICGAISRLITTNCAGVPLAEVLPVYMMQLPLRKDFDENYHVVLCFETLYEKAPEAMAAILEQVTAIIIQVISQKEYTEHNTFDLATNFLLKICKDHPGLAASVKNAAPEVAEILKDL